MKPSRLARVLGVLLLTFAATLGAQTQTAVEYYYAAWDYYFVTSFPDEVAVLDSGAFGGVWKRTGQTFEVLAQPGADALPTCRFFSTSFAPKSSHFYTPFAAECNGLKTGADWQYESIAFYLQLPNAAGNCPAGTVTLYRLYNQGMGGAPNHRYTTSVTIFNQMLAAGWVLEGNGDTGAFACVPPGGPVAQSAEGLWRGTSTSGRTVTVAVLNDGTYYLAYSNPAGTGVDGAVHGTSTAANGQFTSVRGRAVSLRSLFAGGSKTISGTYVAKTSLNLVVGVGATAESVAATYDASYDAPGNVAALAGTYKGYSGHYADAYPTTSTIDSTGRLLVHGACEHSGQLTPRGSTGVFDLSFISGCLPAGSPALKGILVFDAARGTIAAMLPLFDDDMIFAEGARQ